MKCIDNNPLDETAINALLDDTASEQIREHVRQCGYCAMLLHESEAIDMKMKMVLQRLDCPSSLELSEYHANILDDDERVAYIEAHIKLCYRCGEELRLLDDFMTSDDKDTDTPMKSATTHSGTPSSSPISRLFISVEEPDRVLRGRMSGPIQVTSEDGTTLFLEVETELNEHKLTGQLNCR